MIFNITCLSDFVLIYNSSFILCSEKASICFKCYVKEGRKCSFKNALVEKSESSTDLKKIAESKDFLMRGI